MIPKLHSTFGPYVGSPYVFPLEGGPDEGFIDALNLPSITSGLRNIVLTGLRLPAWTRVQAISLNHVRPSCLLYQLCNEPEQTFTQHATVPSNLSAER